MPQAKKLTGKNSSKTQILLVCLLLSVSIFASDIRVQGLEEPVSTNIEKRLNEYSTQEKKTLSQLTAPVIEEQVIKAIEPFGYFKAQIQVAANQRPLLIRVLPGPQMRVNELSVRITGEGLGNFALMQALENLPLKKGDPLLSKVYEDSKDNLLSTAEHQGYLKARFTVAQILVDKKSYTARVTLVLDTGPRFYFGHLLFDETYLSHDFLKRFAPFDYGQAYSTDDIIKFNRQLSASGYFKSVVIKPDINAQRLVPVHIHTQPVSRISYSIGAGYGTDTGPRGRLSLHVNPVNKKGHKFNMIAQGSQRENALQAQYLIPGHNPVTTEYSLAASVGRMDYNSGLSNAVLLSALANYKIDNFQRSLSINALHDRYTYTNQPQNTEFTLYPQANFTFSKTTDPMFTPTGYNLSLNALGASRQVGSSVSLAQASLDLKAAYTLDLIRTRFFMHGMLAYTSIKDINNLPMALSLFLGGNDNLKAYSINSIGPGRVLNYGGIEIQKETVEKWYLVGFFDAGDVYNPNERFMKYDAGVALMWVSPLGPIKVGVAQALNNDLRRDKSQSPKLVINMGPDL